MEEEITITEVLSILKKWWKLIVGISVLLSACVAVFLLFQPKTYQSYSIVRIGVIGNKPLRTSSEINSIMHSQYVTEEILGRLNLPINKINLEKIPRLSKFENVDMLVTIKATGVSPDEAFNYVKVITDMLIERHNSIYEAAKKEFIDSSRIVKERMAPLPISTSINDIVSFLAPSKIEIPPQKIEIPLPTKKKATVLGVFFLSIVALTFLSFLLEGTSKSK